MLFSGMPVMFKVDILYMSMGNKEMASGKTVFGFGGGVTSSYLYSL